MTYPEFEKHMKDIVNIHEYQDSLIHAQNEFNNRSKEDAFVMFPTLEENVRMLLEFMLNDNDEWISYWLYELDCGKKYQPGMITDADDTDIRLKTIRDLWNVLHMEEV